MLYDSTYNEVPVFVKTKNIMVVPRIWGYRVSVGEDDKVLEMDGGDGCTAV